MIYNSLDAQWCEETIILNILNSGTRTYKFSFNGLFYQACSDSWYIPDIIKQLYQYNPVLFERGLLKMDGSAENWHWCEGGGYLDRGLKPNLIYQYDLDKLGDYSCYWRGLHRETEKHPWTTLLTLGYLDE